MTVFDFSDNDSNAELDTWRPKVAVKKSLVEARAEGWTTDEEGGGTTDEEGDGVKEEGEEEKEDEEWEMEGGERESAELMN